MLFNSYIFVLLFLPVTVAGWFLLNRCFRRSTAAHVFLLGMCLFFYGYFNIAYLPIILVSILGNFGLYRLIRRGDKWRLPALIAALVLDLGLLFYFKYYDFFIENLNAVFHTGAALHHLLLPLGISFFTFQQMSFVIDAYRGEVGDYPFLDYALFVTYFPQLIAGPIVTHEELVPQFGDEERRRFRWDAFASGSYLFALGLAKKVLIADTFGNAVNWGYQNLPSLSSASAAVVMLSYTIQIYFDFSGYCDMAIGIGRMMNIDLPLNFRSPYKSVTITEFWSRWHMTLTRFFTRYVYIPLGGNRKGEARTYLNSMIVFLVSGLWHGANWTFVLWGAVHGLFFVVTKRFSRFFSRLPKAVGWFITFLFVNLAWVLFRADSIGDAAQLIGRIFSFGAGGIAPELLSAFALPELAEVFRLLLPSLPAVFPAIYLVLFLSVTTWLLLGSRSAFEKAQHFAPTAGRAAVTALLTAWCVLSFSGVSTFLYFNF